MLQIQYMTLDLKHDYKKKIMKSFFQMKIYVLAILKNNAIMKQNK
ncbi:hypothetical protein B4147_3055 [Bacillus wiedmannii]|uniref:Uncharacterized protein n=1 Tax=Bacillus wiedmannii TaxID=1890302 RepID=A0A0G8CCJ7_9BACI|nr:hypothetical protein B4147_3055 [Bacillus wiedmannii]